MNEAIKACYLFIAELNGYKAKTEEEKIAYGKKCYAQNITPEETEETLHEVIWLERLYDQLNRHVHHILSGSEDKFHWSVPVECDASASMIGIMGALLGEKRMLEMTNMAGPEGELNDPWFIEGLPRNYVKAAAVPLLYGSAQGIHELWDSLDYTTEQLEIMRQELRKGALGVANMFKEFIINNCNPSEEMEVVIGDNEFTVRCNHWKKVGEATIMYDLLDTETGRVRRIAHTKTKAIPDLERFRRFFVTCLVHNLDGQAADYVSGKTMDKYGFCIDIHDAFVVSPEAAADVRMWYAEFIDYVYANRKTILENYFRSIGIGASAMAEWESLMSNVQPVENFKCRTSVLK